MSRDMRFPTIWYVRPAKAQTSLRIRAVWSEPLLVDWIIFNCKATDWTQFGVSRLNRKFDRLIWVYTCQNATLLEITSRLNGESVKRDNVNMTMTKIAVMPIILFGQNLPRTNDSATFGLGIYLALWIWVPQCMVSYWSKLELGLLYNQVRCGSWFIYVLLVVVAIPNRHTNVLLVSDILSTMYAKYITNKEYLIVCFIWNNNISALSYYGSALI